MPHLGFGNLTGDMVSDGSGVLQGVELEPEMYAIADFPWQILWRANADTALEGNSIHIFPGSPKGNRSIIPLPPINLHFLIDNTEVWSETIPNRVQISLHARRRSRGLGLFGSENPSATTIDPFETMVRDARF